METRLQSGARVAPAGDTARQFVVERECASEPSDPRSAALFPIALWVETPSRYQPEDICGGKKWVINQKQAVEFRSQFGASTDAEYTVCSCQGHFIE